MITVSRITKVESTRDNPGWVIYFDENKHFLRVSAKYKVRFKVGDEITLYNFPQTRGLELNGKVVFMHEPEAVTSYYGQMDTSISNLKKVERTMSVMKRRCKV